MLHLVIVGAGDHGRTALETTKACNAVAARYQVLGYVDDDPAKQGREVGGAPVLGGLDWIERCGRDGYRYVLALASCPAKRTLADRLERFRLTFETLVHPTATIGSGVDLGRGTIIGAGAVIAFDTVIGDHVTVNLNSTIGHDCVVGTFSTVAPGANVAGKVKLGEGCDIGLNAAVGKGVHVGEWSSVGAGTVVVKDVPPHRQVFGNPARLLPPVGEPT
jgi:sugar O-acyltransferase (sialic acid O-acetyltransferase NeuD family)